MVCEEGEQAADVIRVNVGSNQQVDGVDLACLEVFGQPPSCRGRVWLEVAHSSTALLPTVNDDATPPSPIGGRPIRLGEGDDRTIAVSDIEKRNVKLHANSLHALWMKFRTSIKPLP